MMTERGHCITRRGFLRAGLALGGLAVCASLAPTSVEAAPTLYGDRYIDELLGCTSGAVITELEAHRNDNKYLGSPYLGVSNSVLHPSDPDVGMNCTGFVVAVVREVGGDPNIITRLAKRKGFTSEPDSIENLIYWRWYLANSDAMYYRFSSKSALLSSGLAKKGDIIIAQPNEWDDNDWFGGDGSGSKDNHVLFFWGDTPSQDRAWHSSHDTKGVFEGGQDITGVIAGKNPGNMISKIYPKCNPCVWYLLPLAPPSAPARLRKQPLKADWI